MNGMKTNSTMIDAFEEWYGTHGVRTYSPNHGTADGHKDYMAAAFWAGYSARSGDFKKLETPEVIRYTVRE
jgi:hypothetical protein